tara:strand:- start:1709 stop:2542 length:834 start_codon:yes stop_codon:yes gene_type:complete
VGLIYVNLEPNFRILKISALWVSSPAWFIFGLILVAFTFINCSNKGIPEIIDKQTNQKSADDSVISSDSLIMDPTGSLQASEVGSNRRPPTATPGNSGNSISNRDTFENYVRKGLVFFTEKSYTESVDMFTKAIELDPVSGVVFFHRGNAYLHMREYENALFDFDRALQLDPRVSHIYNGRGRAYSGKGDHESAIDDFSSAIELDPIDPISFYNRGSSYQLLGLREESIMDFTRAIELDSGFIYAYYNRGWAYKELGKQDLAALDFDMSCKLGGLMC